MISEFRRLIFEPVLGWRLTWVWVATATWVAAVPAGAVAACDNGSTLLAGPVTFTGSNYIALPDSQGINFGRQSFSVCLDFRIDPAAASGTRHLVTKAPSVWGAGWYIAYTDWLAGGPVRGLMAKVSGEATGGETYDLLMQAPSIYDGAWHSLSLVRRADTMTLILDGVEVVQVQAPDLGSLSNNNPIVLGRHTDPIGHHIGQIRNFRVEGLASAISWTKTTDLPGPTVWPCAVSANGRLYVMGDANSSPTNNWNLRYDPTTQIWARLSPIPTGRGQSAAAVADDHIFYLAGNSCTDNCWVNTHEAYDIAADNWVIGPDVPGDGRGHLSAAAVDGKIYLMGGVNSRTVPTYSYNHMYDPASGAWTEKAPLPRPRSSHAAVALNGKIYLIGGQYRLEAVPPTWNAEVDVYDPATDTWSQVAPLPMVREQLCAVVARGKIYAIGGVCRNDATGWQDLATSVVEEYDPATNVWRAVDPLPQPRYGAAAAVIDDVIYVVGGCDSTAVLADVFKGGLRQYDCNGNGIPDETEIADGVLLDSNRNSQPDICETLPGHVRAVREGANGTGDGRSWINAFADLQAALAAAESSAGTITELWIAAGTYRPADTGASRSSTFHLRGNLAIYGGFAGQELSINQRDFRKNRTIFSGDLAGNDVGFANTSDNCYHVVTAPATAANARIDGVIVTAGNANGSGQAAYGGGMYMDMARPAVANCTFLRNQAKLRGGGLYAQWVPHAALENCTFAGNRCDGDGGAVCLQGSDIELINATFHGNIAARSGAGVYAMAWASPLIRFSTFTANYAGSSGGALAVANSLSVGEVSLENCILWGDSAPLGPELSIAAYEGFTSLRATGCDIQGGRNNVYVGDNSELSWDGNFDLDPRLTPDGHLQQAFPVAVTVPQDIPASDRDGDSRPNGAGLHLGADQYVDNDQDLLADAWEKQYGLDPTLADTDGNGIPDTIEDTDGDGLSNQEEHGLYASNPIAPPIYVDGPHGQDTNDGSSVGGTGTGVGPKKTIQAALDAAREGDTVVVLPGIYAEAGNRNLDFAGKAVVVRARDGAAVTHIRCGNAARAVNPQRLHGAAAALVGFTISGGAASEGGALQVAENRLLLVDCVLSDNQATLAGGALHARSSALTLADLTIGGNRAPSADAGLLSNAKVQLEGRLSVQTGTINALSSHFDGPGLIELGSAATLRVTGKTANASATRLRTGLTGSGRLVIDSGQTLTLGGQGYLEMRDTEGGQGRIDVLGTLIVEDQASVRHTRMEIKAASVESNGSISENEISLAGALSSGGQFFVQGQARIHDNLITSEGDRYLDLDPDPAAPRPYISNNRLHVIVPPDPVMPAGALLELRALDYDCGTPGNPDCRSGAHAAPESPGFTADPSANWVIDTLEILPGARLNLTNRPGFRYQANVSHPETIYVKTLILHENAVLNTALQSLYYENLVQHAGSRIVDEPLLGFSLGIIAMDDTTASPFNEFEIRIQRRERDPADAQPLPPTPPLEGKVQLLSHARGPGNGVMEMATRGPDRQSATSVAAKGSFARAGDEDITIAFEYLFTEVNENTRLDIYLSDSPLVGTRSFKVAELRPPAAGSMGGVGSSKFAWFSGEFPRVVPGVYELNFTRGTYVEIELRGADSRVRIDQFDPRVICEQCATFDLDSAATYLDYLILLAETGQPVPDGKQCLDLSADGYVDLADTLVWSVIYNRNLDLCPSHAPASLASVPSPDRAAKTWLLAATESSPVNVSGRMLIAGKPAELNEGEHPDLIYGLGDSSASVNPGQPLTCAEGFDCRHGLSRIIVDTQGTPYLVHGVHGIVRADTGEAMVAPAEKGWQGKSVIVGLLPDGRGAPLTDAAFPVSGHADGSLYVAPVTVVVPAAGTVPYHTYPAAARLVIGTNKTDYQVAAVFGIDPFSDADPCANCTPTVPGGRCRPLCDFSAIRAVEVDTEGNLLVVTASHANDNDWLLVFNEKAPSAAFLRSRTRLASLFEGTGIASPRSPSAVWLTPRTPHRLFLSASLHETDGLATPIYRFDFDPPAAVFTFSGLVHVEHPAPPTEDGQIGQTSGVSALQVASDGDLHVVGFSAPRFGEIVLNIDRMFTLPTLAVVPANAAWNLVASQAPRFQASALEGGGLALPLSAVLLPGRPGDLDGDEDVDGDDLHAFVDCATGPMAGPVSSKCSRADMDHDGDVDQVDFGLLQRSWTGSVSASPAGR